MKIIISTSSFNSLNIKKLSQENIVNLWNEFIFEYETVSSRYSNFKGELNKLFDLSNVNICINLSPINKQKAKKQLDNALNKIKTNEQYAFSVSQKSEAQQYYNAFLDQQQAVIDDVDVLKDMLVFIIAYGNKKALNNTKRQLKDLGNITSWKYENLLFLQQDSLLVSYTWTKHIPKITDIEMTCNTFATSFPIPDMHLKMKKDFYWLKLIQENL